MQGEVGICALQQGRGYRCSLSRCLRTCACNSDSYKSAALTPTGWTIVAALTCRLRHKQLGEMLNSLNVFSQMCWGGACLLSASRFAFIVRHPAACGVRRFVCVRFLRPSCLRSLELYAGVYLLLVRSKMSSPCHGVFDVQVWNDGHSQQIPVSCLGRHANHHLNWVAF